MKKHTIFDDYLWNNEKNLDGYTVIYKPTNFEVFVRLTGESPFGKQYAIGDFKGNKFEIMGKIKEMAIKYDNSKTPIYKYDVLTEDDDIEGYESPMLHCKGDKVITNDGKYLTIFKVRNNGNPV